MIEKIYEIFTQEYREETKRLEFEFAMLKYFKLKCENENGEEKIRRLSEEGFISDFKQIPSMVIANESANT